MTKSPFPTHRRRWLQFSLPGILIATAICGAVAGWYRYKLTKEQPLVPIPWDVETGENVKWVAELGIQNGEPVVANGRVFVTSNLRKPYQRGKPRRADVGVLRCFRESDGELLWQDSAKKLAAATHAEYTHDFKPTVPFVEGDRLWYVNFRNEVVCLDTNGFHDGQNDGRVQNEVSTTKDDSDVVWKFDLYSKLGALPRWRAHTSVTVGGSRVFVVTSANEYANRRKPQIGWYKTTVPSFACLDKQSGKLLWTDSSPSGKILRVQWGTPSYGKIAGVPQVIFPGGDGWLYSFDPRGTKNGKSRLLWKFDCNPKASRWHNFKSGDRNFLLAAPAIYKDRVYVAVGRSPGTVNGEGRLWCIDGTRRGDISPDLVSVHPSRDTDSIRTQAYDQNVDRIRPNPNSGAVWQFHTHDWNGDGTIEREERLTRSFTRAAVADDLLFVTGYSGLVRCFDTVTGTTHWVSDALIQRSSSPVIVGDHVYVLNQWGEVAVFRLSADPKIAMPSGKPVLYIEDSFGQFSDAYAPPASSGNTLFITSDGSPKRGGHLYALDVLRPQTN